MPRRTPITDFLFRLEVDSDFVNRVLNPDPGLRDAALVEFLPDDADTRAAIVSGIEDGDFRELQRRVLAEHTDTVKIIPRGWVR
jgi:hypothetical protein